LERLFTTEVFDAATAAQAFRLAVSDYSFSTMGPALVTTILRQSPSSTVSCEVLDTHAFDGLDTGTLDLVVYGRTPPDRYRSQLLFTDRYVCVVSDDHPLAHRKSVSLSEYLRWPHLTVDIGQPGIDRALEAHDTSRRVTVRMPYHMLAAGILPGTELLLTIPARLVPHFTDAAHTRTLAAPREFDRLQFYAVWHPRLDDDPSHRWLREIVRSVASPMPRSKASTS
jgi:DNA-binding transcriptional LysR family regulator